MYKQFKQICIILFLSLSALYSIHSQATTPKLSIEEAILADVNAYRKQRHLQPLKMDARISKQAQIHSINMAQHRLPFGHINFLKRVHIVHKEIKNSGAASENVAYNYKDAHDVVKNWLQSPGHKRNIVGNYDLTGLGIARDAKGRMYFTQMFFKKQAAPVVTRAGMKRASFPQFSLNSIFKRSAS
jgi:uncharacterized protein YkwD